MVDAAIRSFKALPHRPCMSRAPVLPIHAHNMLRTCLYVQHSMCSPGHSADSNAGSSVIDESAADGWWKAPH